MNGLMSFVSTMYACATKFLSNHVVTAKAAVHKLELALAAMRPLMSVVFRVCAPLIATLPQSLNCMLIWTILVASLFLPM